MVARDVQMWAVKTPSGGIDPYSIRPDKYEAARAHIQGPRGNERLFRGESYDVTRVTVSEVQDD